MIRRRSLRTRAIKMLVLDEADEMLNKGMSNKFLNFHRVKWKCGTNELSISSMFFVENSYALGARRNIKLIFLW